MPWIGALIGGAVSLISASNSSDAASEATSAQTASSAEAIAEQRRQYDLTRSDNTPFRNTGLAANKRLAYLLGTGQKPDASRMAWSPEELQSQIASLQQQKAANTGPNGEVDPAFDNAIDSAQSALDGGNPPGGAYGSLLRKFSIADRDADPVYQSGLQFGLDQGRDAINARAIAGGGYDSGATLRALTKFGNDYGSTKAEGSYNRYNADNTNIYNKLAGISGSGQVATNAISSAGTNTSNNISELLTGAGNARAAGIVGGANAWGSAAENINSAYNNYQRNQRLNALYGRSSGSSGYNGGYSQGDLNAMTEYWS